MWAIVESRLRRVRGSLLVRKYGEAEVCCSGKKKRVFWFSVFLVILHAGHPAISESPLKLGFGDPDKHISLIP